MSHPLKHSAQSLSRLIAEESHNHVEAYMFGTRAMRVAEPAATGCVSTLSLNTGFALTTFNVVFRQPFRLHLHCQVPHLVEIGIILSGNVNMRVQGCRREYDSLSGQSYASVYSGEIGTATSMSANQHVQMLELRLTPEALKAKCAELGVPVPQNLQRPLANAPNSPYKCTSVANLAMKRLGQQILALHDDETAQPFLLESLCHELLFRYLTFANDGVLPTHNTLAPRDVERVREARFILASRLDNPPSLSELARLVNLNDFKLKLGFRQAFGTTAYRYLKQVRLQEARRRLQERQESVTEVALAVGYRNLGDFGIAFKQKYGVSPRELRTGKKSVFR